MLHSLPSARRPLPLVLGVAGLVTAGALAGCGGGSKQQASTASSPSASTPAALATSTTPAPTETAIGPSKNIPQHVRPSGVPKAAQPVAPRSQKQENTLPPATPADKLIVKSHTGTSPKWRVAAQMQDSDTVCVAVSSLGQSTPTPACQSGTQAAVDLLTSAGQGQGEASVAQVQRTVRTPPSDILVSGDVTGDVTKVVIDYRHQKYTAQLSEHTVSLKVDRAEAAEIAGKKVDVPNPITLKVFGISIPKVNGNPPTSAQLKGKKPVAGVLTFELQ